MNTLEATQILRKFLVALPPAGQYGFEGLVGACLSRLTGRIFRVKRSGPQGGYDGRSDPWADEATLYECKRYDDTDLKLGDLARKIEEAAEPADLDVLWILVATVSVDANVADEVRLRGERHGIGTLIIDWLPHDLPDLAVLLASTPTAVEAWWSERSQRGGLNAPYDGPDFAAVVDASAAIDAAPSFDARRASLLERVNSSDVAYPLYARRLVGYHTQLFKDTKRARQEIGQPLAPGAVDVRLVHRTRVLDDFDRKIWGRQDNYPSPMVTVLGEEGVGKSWLVGTWWSNRASNRPLLFIPARDAAAFDDRRDAAEGLIAAALRRTAGRISKEDEAFFGRKLKRWKQRPPQDGPIVVLDGLNERDIGWRFLLPQVHSLVVDLNGHLVVTCRPGYYATNRLEEVDIPERRVDLAGYNDEEFAEALHLNGRSLDSVPKRLRPGLRNPRVFALAIEMLDDLDENDLTIDRILMRYWQSRARHRDLVHTDQEFLDLVRSHAAAVKSPTEGRFELDRWQDHAARIRRGENRTLARDLDEIIEGRFMEPTEHPLGRAAYAFRPEVVPFAMGLRLVFDVRTDADADPKRSVEDHFLAAIEPIAAFDRTFEIVLGALAVACLHRPWHESSSMRRRNDELTRTIISHLLTMQNRDEALRSEFVSFVREDAEAFLDAAEAQTATGKNMADEWLIEALRHGRVRSPDTRRSKAAADLINRRLAQWIACIPALAAQQHSTYFEQRLLIEVSTWPAAGSVDTTLS